MATVKEDTIGLWISSCGYIARPVGTTRFKKGDKVKNKHFAGSPLHGVGKDGTCERGDYLETWLGCGQVHADRTPEQRQRQYEWYMNYARSTYPLMFKEESNG